MGSTAGVLGVPAGSGPSPVRPAHLPAAAAALPYLQEVWLSPSAAVAPSGAAQQFGRRIWAVWASALAVALGLFPPDGSTISESALWTIALHGPPQAIDVPLLVALAAALAIEGDWQALDEMAAALVQSWLLRLPVAWVA